MTEYFVFKFCHHDELGGWGDFHTAHTELKDAIASAESVGMGNRFDFAQVVNITALKVIEERFLWEEGNMMVTKSELLKLREEREEQIARIQQARGLIA